MNLARWEDDGGPPGFAPAEYPPRMSDPDLKAFVMGWLDGKIFSDLHCDEGSLRYCFVVLALGGAQLCEEPENVGRIWEWLAAAGPSGINGYPMFFSCRFLHRLDWERARVAILAEEERRAAVRV